MGTKRKGTQMRHSPGAPCPINPGEPIEWTFTDHERPGVFNACSDCHDDHRTVGERLADLERTRAAIEKADS